VLFLKNKKFIFEESIYSVIKSSLSKAYPVTKTIRVGRVASSFRVIFKNFMDLPVL
jgi:hypothetical protein